MLISQWNKTGHQQYAVPFINRDHIKDIIVPKDNENTPIYFVFVKGYTDRV